MLRNPTLGFGRPRRGRAPRGRGLAAGRYALCLAVPLTMFAAEGAEAARVIRHPKAEAKAAALAAQKEKAAGKTATAPAGGKPTLVATFGDWGAYLAQGAKSRICYALASPKDRAPASLKREPGYIFISSRPGEGVRNEVSVIVGFPVKEGGADAKAEIGTTSFDLVTKGQNAWMKNAAQEGQLVDVMRKHGRLVVKVPAAKGGVATDSYSLAGLGDALARVSKDCP